MTLQKHPGTVSSSVAAGAVQNEVTVLMAVCNGADCLSGQLESIAAQTHGNWRLLASDDGSADDSAALLQAFAAKHPSRTICLEGPRRGAAQNFLFLIREAAARSPSGGWLAFSDQDDVWLPDRLSAGIAALEPCCADRPALYCSRTWITDHGLKTRRLSAARPRPPGFRNALVQNIASGNTILLNPAAARLVMAAAQDVEDLVVHDWWVYQLIAGAGGQVVHDDRPTLLYRQHSGNQIGANDRLRARLRRIYQLLRGDFRDWNAVNITALRACVHYLNAENRSLLERFAAMRKQRLPVRLVTLARLHLYRQSAPATMALWVAAMLGRL